MNLLNMILHIYTLSTLSKASDYDDPVAILDYGMF